jgi:hypothetical protein
MTKRELVDHILEFNASAQPEFLARFDETDLQEYLAHLHRLRTPRLAGDRDRYRRYFESNQASALRPVASESSTATMPVEAYCWVNPDEQADFTDTRAERFANYLLELDLDLNVDALMDGLDEDEIESYDLAEGVEHVLAYEEDFEDPEPQQDFNKRDRELELVESIQLEAPRERPKAVILEDQNETELALAGVTAETGETEEYAEENPRHKLRSAINRLEQYEKNDQNWLF